MSALAHTRKRRTNQQGHCGWTCPGFQEDPVSKVTRVTLPGVGHSCFRNVVAEVTPVAAQSPRGSVYVRLRGSACDVLTTPPAPAAVLFDRSSGQNPTWLPYAWFTATASLMAGLVNVESCTCKPDQRVLSATFNSLSRGM